MNGIYKKMLLGLLASVSISGMLRAISGRYFLDNINKVENVIKKANPTQADLTQAGSALQNLENAFRITPEPANSDRYKRFLKAQKDYNALLPVAPAGIAPVAAAAPAPAAPAGLVPAAPVARRAPAAPAGIPVVPPAPIARRAPAPRTPPLPSAAASKKSAASGTAASSAIAQSSSSWINDINNLVEQAIHDMELLLTRAETSTDPKDKQDLLNQNQKRESQMVDSINNLAAKNNLTAGQSASLYRQDIRAQQLKKRLETLHAQKEKIEKDIAAATRPSAAKSAAQQTVTPIIVRPAVPVAPVAPLSPTAPLVSAAVYKSDLFTALAKTTTDEEKVEIVEDLWNAVKVPRMANDFNELKLTLDKLIALGDALFSIKAIANSNSGQALARELKSANDLAANAVESGLWNGRAIAAIQALKNSIQKAGDEYKNEEQQLPAAAPISQISQGTTDIHLRLIEGALDKAENSKKPADAKKLLGIAKNAIDKVEASNIGSSNTKFNELKARYETDMKNYSGLKKSGAESGEEQPLPAAAPAKTLTREERRASLNVLAMMLDEVNKAATPQERKEALDKAGRNIFTLQLSGQYKDMKRFTDLVDRYKALQKK